MSTLSRWIRLVPALVLLLAASLACRPDDPDVNPAEVSPSPPPAASSVSCPPNGGALYLGCPSFPNTSPTAQPQWDYFAWNSFAAANWPALDPAKNNEQRGFPDLNQRFTSAANTSLLVWETFKEKREVFFYPPTTNIDPGPWNQAPNYGPLPNPPLCSDSQGKPAVPRRLFGQGGKLVYDSLDETVEVLSEALEQPAALCGGFTKNPCSQTGTGTPNCSCVVGLPVAPRVWKGSPTKPNPQPVLYEVKVNYDFYNYVQQNKYYLDSTAQAAANNSKGTKIQLPYRTSAPLGPGGGGSGPTAVTSYDAQSCIANYLKAGPNTNVLPCLVGSIHIKTAWIPLQNEDPSKYHTAEAAYFKTENGKACMSYATFGLVGIHIIQRVHQGSGGVSTGSTPKGGTFIFSTWEHVDNDEAGFTYANYFPGQPFAGPPQRATFYPQPSNAIPVVRKYPILPGTQQVNNQVHAAIKAVNPSSVWLNYELVGTQFQAIDIQSLPPNPSNPNDPTGIGQPLYLANLVIETNEGLQHFQGLPPLVAPVAPFNKAVAKNGTLAFNRATSNVAFSPTGNPSAIKGFNMGGCMGCHGVAQNKGYSFSFVLFDGQRGADVDTQSNFALAPVSR
ncbi:MAG: hypothetical protein QOH06_5276 [Acidobacteriota bacterium]|jgi:hypothetical protein|nr:hypothetical protein [Acidobacteriota bacterium]